MDLLLNNPKSLNGRFPYCFFVLDDKELSPHIDQISEHIHYKNQKVNFYDQMRTMIVNLGSKKCYNNNNSYPQLSHINISLLMRIFDTPEKDLSNVEGKAGTRKVRTSLVKSYSTLFSC